MALLGLVVAGFCAGTWPLKTTVFLLGVANGAFSIAAIGSMMTLAGQGHESREGVRMGLWGAAQAVAFGLGGVLGTAASDLARWWFGAPAVAYSVVFGLEAVLFVAAAWLALRGGAISANLSAHAITTPSSHAGVVSARRSFFGTVFASREPQIVEPPIASLKLR